MKKVNIKKKSYSVIQNRIRNPTYNFSIMKKQIIPITIESITPAILKFVPTFEDKEK